MPLARASAPVHALPKVQVSPLRSERFLSAAVALLLAAVAAWLALGTTPGLGPLDAGDMTTASATLGVPHATGFPVHTLLGRALMWLPVGNLAHRAALGSAFLTAVAICGVAWLAQAGAKGAATRATRRETARSARRSNFAAPEKAR